MRTLILAFSLIVSIACTKTVTQTPTVAAAGGQSPGSPSSSSTYTPSSTSAPPASEKPDGTAQTGCDYVLGDFSSNSPSGFRFLADAKVHNTGNVGIVVDVTAHWDQLGTDPVKQTKTVRVDYGKTRKVDFTYLATQDELDLLQADSDQGCAVKTSIVDTYGDVH